MKTKTVTVPEHTIEVTFAAYVGQRIRQRRQELGLSQDQVTKAVDISKAFLSECERGKRSIGFAKLYELSRLLKRPTDWFVEGWE